jgi:hypothetical protein
MKFETGTLMILIDPRDWSLYKSPFQALQLEQQIENMAIEHDKIGNRIAIRKHSYWK